MVSARQIPRARYAPSDSMCCRESNCLGLPCTDRTPGVRQELQAGAAHHYTRSPPQGTPPGPDPQQRRLGRRPVTELPRTALCALPYRVLAAILPHASFNARLWQLGFCELYELAMPQMPLHRRRQEQCYARDQDKRGQRDLVFIA